MGHHSARHIGLIGLTGFVELKGLKGFRAYWAYKVQGLAPPVILDLDVQDDELDEPVSLLQQWVFPHTRVREFPTLFRSTPETQNRKPHVSFID